MDHRLDLLITAAAPQLSDGPDLDGALGQVIAETQSTAAAKRFRIGRRWCLVAATLVVAVAAGVGVAGASRVWTSATPFVSGADRAALSVQIPMAPDSVCVVAVSATSRPAIRRPLCRP